MKKRALAALLALILCISCFTPAGNAAAAVKQQDVEVQLINLMKQYCGTYWAQNYYGARQCKGFADMISDKLFGLTGGPGPYSDSRYYLPNAESRGYQKIGILAPGSCTAENLRALFLKARPGDYVQCVRYTGTQHSLIVADVHTTGVTFFDCNLKNLKASDLCACYFYDWQEIGTTFTRGCSLYRYSGYVANGTPSLLFNANGGTCATSSKAVAAGSAFGTLPTPERKGYKFDYWYIISCNTSREPDRYQVNANTVKTSLCDTVLFAHWTKDTGPCANGHSWSAPQTIAPTCTDNGYTLETCNVCDAARITRTTATPSKPATSAMPHASPRSSPPWATTMRWYPPRTPPTSRTGRSATCALAAAIPIPRSFPVNSVSSLICRKTPGTTPTCVKCFLTP